MPEKAISLLYLLPALGILILLILSRGEKLPDGGDMTDGIRGWFTRGGAFLYKKLSRFLNKRRDAQIRMYLGLIDPRRNAGESGILYYADKIGMTLLIVFAGSILAAMISFSARSRQLVDEQGHIARGDYGNGTRQETLVMSETGSEEESEIRVEITDRQYTREEADALAREAVKQLPLLILNGNTSLDEVRSDLDLVKRLPGYPFSVSWKVSNYSLIHSGGKLQKENIPEEGAVVTLTAQLTYLDDEWDEEIPICILPELLTPEEEKRQRIREALGQADQASVTETYLALPSQIDEEPYTWKGKIRDDAPILFLLILITAAAVFIMKDKDLEKKARERDEALCDAYPQLVSRLVLYLGAGMTVRGVFYKFAQDYIAQKKKDGRFSFLYEEICRVVNELESGISEQTAYEHFALRCRSQPYTRLCTLLTQNLRKGSSGLLVLLREESRKALNDRMSRARKRGEEAGTKLLLPMMLMLVIVMVIIMIPAYQTF